jgi:hypothetical protein
VGFGDEADPNRAPRHETEIRQFEPGPPPSGAIVNAEVAALENDEGVRQRITERLQQLPQLSARETKRLLTTWQYYVRVVVRSGLAEG